MKNIVDEQILKTNDDTWMKTKDLIIGHAEGWRTREGQGW